MVFRPDGLHQLVVISPVYEPVWVIIRISFLFIEVGKLIGDISLSKEADPGPTTEILDFSPSIWITSLSSILAIL